MHPQYCLNLMQALSRGKMAVAMAKKRGYMQKLGQNNLVTKAAMNGGPKCGV